jgi:hypothetical protein
MTAYTADPPWTPARTPSGWGFSFYMTRGFGPRQYFRSPPPGPTHLGNDGSGRIHDLIVMRFRRLCISGR